MQPRLSYGRHRGPAGLGHRDAAVMIALMPRSDDKPLDDLSNWQVPLIRRPQAMRHHGGQIALPGGRLEPGEDSKQAAVREFTEELGVAPTVRYWLDDLPTHHVFASGHQVAAHVAVIDPVREFSPQASEVDQVHVIAADVINDRQFLKNTREHRPHQLDETLGWSFRTPAIVTNEIRIWGMTAMILTDLVHLLLTSKPGVGE